MVSVLGLESQSLGRGRAEVMKGRAKFGTTSCIPLDLWRPTSTGLEALCCRHACQGMKRATNHRPGLRIGETVVAGFVIGSGKCRAALMILRNPSRIRPYLDDLSQTAEPCGPRPRGRRRCRPKRQKTTLLCWISNTVQYFVGRHVHRPFAQPHTSHRTSAGDLLTAPRRNA